MFGIRIYREFAHCSKTGSTLLRQNVRQFRRPREMNAPRTDSTTFGLAINKNRLLAGAAGLSGLCVYGLVSGPKTSMSVFDRAAFFPEHVKHRLRSTYAYLAGTTAICAASALQLARNQQFIMRFASPAGCIGMMVVTIGSGIICRMIPYPQDGGLGMKHVAWLAYAGILGASVAPICMLGGSVITQAAAYTGGIVGGLSLVAACAPSDKFLYIGGPLAMGLGVVFVSSLGTLFASPISRLGMGLQAISMYGGLALFSGMLLYDTQKMVHRAENQIAYDPINQSMNVFIDALNIFVRMAMLSANGQRRK